MKAIKLGPKTTKVSGNRSEGMPKLYLASFLSTIVAATVPALLVAKLQCNGAKESGHLASQAIGLPCFHRTRVTPSGH